LFLFKHENDKSTKILFTLMNITLTKTKKLFKK